MSKVKLYPDQIVPLSLTSIVFVLGTILLYITIIILNKLVIAREVISPHLKFGDVLVGLTIYLKTSIDFAIFIGRLMHRYPGWKNRIVIEIGTALGNVGGTLAILLLWDVFREVKVLMAIMIVVAALVLLRMAEDGFDHVKDEEGKYKITFGGLEVLLEKILHTFNSFVAPVLNKLIPKMSVKEDENSGYIKLFMLSLTIPFILGLDDFAGYIPLFNVVNVFGFATGVFLGHMILNIALFLSPKTTIKAVKHPTISFIGSIAFIGLAIWGFVEAAKLIGFEPHVF